MVASATAGAPPAARGPSTLTTSGAALGNATLAITSGFAPQPGAPNPLAGHLYTLLRDSYANIIAKAGMTVPPGMSPY